MLFRSVRLLLPVFTLFAFLPTLAVGGSITYTFSGTGSGTLNGTPFTNQPYSFTFVLDTTQITNVGGVLESPIGTSGTFSEGGTSGTLTDPGLYLFLNNGAYVHAVGIGNSGTTDHLDISDPSLAGYDLVLSFGPITTNSPYLGTPTSTSAGNFFLSSGSATFQATASRPSSGPGEPPSTATPEPSTALLGLPLALLLFRRLAGR